MELPYDIILHIAQLSSWDMASRIGRTAKVYHVPIEEKIMEEFRDQYDWKKIINTDNPGYITKYIQSKREDIINDDESKEKLFSLRSKCNSHELINILLFILSWGSLSTTQWEEIFSDPQNQLGDQKLILTDIMINTNNSTIFLGNLHQDWRRQLLMECLISRKDYFINQRQFLVDMVKNTGQYIDYYYGLLKMTEAKFSCYESPEVIRSRLRTVNPQVLQLIQILEVGTELIAQYWVDRYDSLDLNELLKVKNWVEVLAVTKILEVRGLKGAQMLGINRLVEVWKNCSFLIFGEYKKFLEIVRYDVNNQNWDLIKNDVLNIYIERTGTIPRTILDHIFKCPVYQEIGMAGRMKYLINLHQLVVKYIDK